MLKSLLAMTQATRLLRRQRMSTALHCFLYEKCRDNDTTVQHTSTPSRSSLLQQLQAQHEPAQQEPEIVEEKEQEVDERHGHEEEQCVSQKRKKGKKSQKKHKRQKVDDE